MKSTLQDLLIGAAVVGTVAYVAFWCGCFGSTSYTPDRKFQVSSFKFLVSSLKFLVCAAGMAWVVEGGYMLVNRVMCGSVSGYARGGVAESGRELVRMVVGAEVHELQAYGILAAVLLALLALRIVRRVRFAADARGGVFVALGLCYHVSMVAMRCMRSFDPLGFRLLYPGTIRRGAPYPELKSRVLGKYRALPSGTTIPCPPMETEDYMILALRPDLKVQ